MEIYILHLYYDVLKLYGEYGNVIIMKRHLEDQGFIVHIERKTIGDEINFLKYQFVYIGCGMGKSLKVVLKDIKRYSNQLKLAIEKNVVFLSTGNSYEMFGKKVDKEEGLNIFDFETISLNNRIVSNVIYSLNKEEDVVLNSVYDEDSIVKNNDYYEKDVTEKSAYEKKYVAVNSVYDKKYVVANSVRQEDKSNNYKVCRFH